MDQLILKITIFLTIFFTSNSAILGEFYFDPNYYDDVSSHVLNTRQFGNVQFGHQNPILAAPTLAPQIKSVELEPEENPWKSPNNEPSWTPVFTHFPVTTTPRIPPSFPHHCPIGFVKSWTGSCIRQQTTPQPNPTSFDDNYRSVTKYLCPVGHIATRPNGLCIPTTPGPPPTEARILYRSTLNSATTPRSSPPSRPLHRVTNVKYGHQNPILVAPTLKPRSTSSSHHTTTHNDFSEPEEWAPTTPNIVLSHCDQGSLHHRIDPRTNQCFLLGSVEPCGGQSRNLAFYAREFDLVYGECDCILGSSRPLVYHKETDTCYFIYQQAYCEEKQWLLLNDQGVPNCKHNPCHGYGEMVLNWDWKRNSNTTYMNTDGIVPVFEVEKCVPLGQICHRFPNGTLVFADITDPSENYSQFLTVLMFQSGSLEPTCKRRNTQSVPQTSRSCRPGSKFYILRGCNVTINRFSESQMGALVNELPNFNFAIRTNNATNWILLLLLSLLNFLQ